MIQAEYSLTLHENVTWRTPSSHTWWTRPHEYLHHLSILVFQLPLERPTKLLTIFWEFSSLQLQNFPTFFPQTSSGSLRTTCQGFSSQWPHSLVSIFYISFFLISVTKYLTKVNLRKERFMTHSLKVPSIMAKAWQHEHETAGHMAPAIKNHKQNTGAHFAFPVIYYRSPAHRVVSPYSEWAFSLHLSLSGSTLTYLT